ncbi:hypothetical protein DRN79_02250 [Methanosarcinales archaeon]|nr:MAG: hypothetical protein DRN79_02250 [Methanosarcinales archaeon]
MATTAFSDSEVRKASFAEVASANRYCRPDVNEGTSSSQVADFVSNDVVLNEEPPQQQHERNISAADSACCHSRSDLLFPRIMQRNC